MKLSLLYMLIMGCYHVRLTTESSITGDGSCADMLKDSFTFFK